jgi:fatty-acyl-CoA synthase
MTLRASKFRNLIEALSAAPSDRPFVTLWIDEDEHETVTFGEFRQRACAQASALRDESVVAGDRVVIVMPQSISAMTTFVGAMMLGAIPAFLAYPNFKIEPAKYRSGLAGVTANLNAKVVVIDDEFPDDLLGHVSLHDEIRHNETRLLRAGNKYSRVAADNLPEAKIQADDIAFIQHSAGTTGLQKGVALTHAAVLRQLDHLANALQIGTTEVDPAKDNGTSDRIYSWLPLYHDMGLIACFILPLVCHLPVVMQSPIDWVMHPETMLQIISEHKCTLGWMPNFAFQFVPRRTAVDRWMKYDLSSVRALINCSEPVRSSSMQEFHNAFSAIGLREGALQSSYAMAENVFAVTQCEVGKPDGPRRIWADGQSFRAAHQVVPVAEGVRGAISLTSSGRLLPGNEVRIVSESGARVPDCTVGEILIRSDSLFTGYYNRPDLTEKAIIDGWYRSGDLGFLYQDELYVVGRKKDLIIVGGENLYPQDVEEIVWSHPAVHDGRAVAMGIFNSDLGTEDLIVVAEVDDEIMLSKTEDIEREIRNLIVSDMGVAVRRIFLKPPKWMVKSTAGKTARSATRDKLLKEHPELNVDSEEHRIS